MMEIEEQIINDYKNGLTRKKICEKYNLSKSFVNYRLRKDFQDILLRRQAKKTTEEAFISLVKKYLPVSNSINNLCNKLGLRGVEGYYTKIQKIIDTYQLDTSHFGTMLRREHDTVNCLTDEEYFCQGKKRDGRNMLQRLINHSYKEYKCECCGLSEWQGYKIPIEIHHLNGNHYDNRLENLQLLCRNCHALTDNFCSKNHIQKEKKKETFSIRNRIEEKVQEYKKEEEIQKILEAFKIHKSFVQTCKVFGITDNGLRKRCIRLNILDKVKEIQKT